jgi:hypothetical protein
MLRPEYGSWAAGSRPRAGFDRPDYSLVVEDSPFGVPSSTLR